MKRAKILIVEDEQLVALDIEQRLTRLGYSVSKASTGREALGAARASRPDLVLMDIRLNGGPDGIEVAQTLHGTFDVPVVYLTAYVDERTLARARGSEPYGYLLKPFDERELRATIEMALRRHWVDSHWRRQEELQRFLADASVRLAASLDYQTVARQAATFIVPLYAEWCLIRLQPSEELAPSFTLTYPGQESEAPASQAPEGTVFDSVLKRGRAEVHPEVGDEPQALVSLLGREHTESILGLGLSPCSLLGVPLVTRGKSLGVIVLLSARHERHYDDIDVTLVEDFAHRFAIAIENALLYRQAQRAVRAREEVLALVTHDLRDLLNTILLRAQRLGAEKHPSDAPAQIVRTAWMMNRLIGDLLDASSIDAGRLSLERHAHSVARMAREAVETLRPLAAGKDLSLGSLPAESVHAECDGARIQQALSNLIVNAIKFTPERGRISLRVEQQDAHAVFAVSDSGPGIPAEQIPRLFERFWYGESRHKGAGLGLYLAKGIIEAHGGSIWVESRPGKGSTFFFTLPLAPPAELQPYAP